MSLQKCLASRKDCSGKGHILTLSEISDICNSTHQAAPSSTLFIVLPDGPDYKGGIYKYDQNGLNLISVEDKTKFTMELYPELVLNDPIELKELVRIGLTWQYLSLKAESIGLGVSQRARGPKKINKIVNDYTKSNHIFLYSVAVRERDRPALIEDKLPPLKKEIKEEGVYLLDTPNCYMNRQLYKNEYKGIPLEDAIFNTSKKNPIDISSLKDISQLLWACQGETDHATHGNRDDIEKNGYGRVHATGCAGYSVYPIVIIENLANLPKGAYVYNPVGFSALNRWITIDSNLAYDHFLKKYSARDMKAEIENEFNVSISNYLIILCIDRKKPCSGFMHRKIMDTTYWAEIEAGMALAGLQLQANALGYKWYVSSLQNPEDSKYRIIFDLDLAETVINSMASQLVNLPKNERLSLKSNLIPTILFSPS